VVIFHFKFVFLSISCVFPGLDESFVAVDGRDAGGQGGGARGDGAELEESGGVVNIAVVGGGRKLRRWHVDVASGVQPDGLCLRYQVVLAAPLNCETLLFWY
jgi:hypothetical protein